MSGIGKANGKERGAAKRGGTSYPDSKGAVSQQLLLDSSWHLMPSAESLASR
jgi:hypothetical protein